MFCVSEKGGLIPQMDPHGCFQSEHFDWPTDFKSFLWFFFRQSHIYTTKSGDVSPQEVTKIEELHI